LSRYPPPRPPLTTVLPVPTPSRHQQLPSCFDQTRAPAATISSAHRAQKKPRPVQERGEVKGGLSSDQAVVGQRNKASRSRSIRLKEYASGRLRRIPKLPFVSLKRSCGASLVMAKTPRGSYPGGLVECPGWYRTASQLTARAFATFAPVGSRQQFYFHH
jgi:hypothetical protein